MHEGLIPEVSIGTHFFNYLVEADMLYFAVYTQKYDNVLIGDFFKSTKNMLTKLLPDAKQWTEVVRVVDSSSMPEDQCICLSADVLKQNAVTYLGAGEPKT